MSDIQRLEVGPRMSEACIFNRVVYLAGQVAADPTADVVGQTQQVLAAIDRLLAQAGSDKSRILSAQVFLADIADFPKMNSVWEPWVVPGATPARATVQAAMASPAYKVEIKVIAAQR
ncbi:MAG: hypothetical protein RL483_1293 [Pseudomonadota bacterium]